MQITEQDPMLGGEGINHLGPIREGCLDEVARELRRGEQNLDWLSRGEVKASQAEEMAQAKHGGRKIVLNGE